MTKKSFETRAMTIDEYGEYLDYVDDLETKNVKSNRRLFDCTKWVLTHIYPNVKDVTVAKMTKIFTETIEKTLRDEDEDLKN